MCTVSFVPAKDGIYLTSNRDEKRERKTASLPQMHSFLSCEMIFPRDADAGGTWIALCSNGNAGVLLNGAFQKHAKKDSYRKSRGLVFLDILDHQQPVRQFQRSPLRHIEPFTLVLWQEGKLYECRWDEQERKYCRTLSVRQPYIWSSSTLYCEAVRRKRQLWFAQWLRQHPQPHHQDIIDFHRFAGDGDRHNDLHMNREGEVITVSITSMAVNEHKGNVTYSDLVHGHEAQNELWFAASKNRILESLMVEG